MRFYKYILIGLILIKTTFCFTQDVEPRRWSILPVNSQIIGAGYANSFGEVLFDPLLEAEDVSVNVSTIVTSYIRSFRLGNKLARIDVTVPYNFIRFEGTLSGNPASLYRNGFGDSRIRFSVNLNGPPPGTIKDIQKFNAEHPVNTIFGASLAVNLPTGQYFDEKLINIGQNQIVIRPQFGMVHTWQSWSYELTGSIFIFTNNNNFFGGKTKKQDPILALQSHLIKRFSSKLWASISASYGIGGESVVNNVSNADLRTNLLSALSTGLKISKRQNLKFVFLNSTTLKDLGSNTNSIIVGWSHIFF
ncbi:transporter [Winogradskyella sp. DF17]|uniref:Transporter n=1 Tax=Winogradskyella pelagia TaxID=2819984 RepID=A0ABS3T3Z1_9FLAO|nr:transporter [Winogradskyella sp. DF17]MBO3117458.1 transporter [Winogradskyella sp. DF17]